MTLNAYETAGFAMKGYRTAALDLRAAIERQRVLRLTISAGKGLDPMTAKMHRDDLAQIDTEVCNARDAEARALEAMKAAALGLP